MSTKSPIILYLLLFAANASGDEPASVNAFQEAGVREATWTIDSPPIIGFSSLATYGNGAILLPRMAIAGRARSPDYFYMLSLSRGALEKHRVTNGETIVSISATPTMNRCVLALEAGYSRVVSTNSKPSYSIALCELDPFRVARTSNIGNDTPNFMALSQDGNRVSFTQGNMLAISDLSKDGIVIRRPLPGGNVTGLTWSPTSTTIAVTMKDLVHFYSSEGDHSENSAVSIPGQVLASVWCKSNVFISLTSNGLVNAYNVDSGKHHMQEMPSGARPTGLSSNGTNGDIIIACEDGAIYAYSANETLRQIHHKASGLEHAACFHRSWLVLATTSQVAVKKL